MTLTRKTVEKMIRERIAQAVILTHHLQNNAEPFDYYVAEKTAAMPSLDSSNQDIFNQIRIILNSAYGVDIEYRVW